jgi:hypothetical protein
MDIRGRATIDDLYRGNRQQIERQIMTESDRVILDSDTEDLVEHFATKYSLTPITIDEGRQKESTYKKRMQIVPAHQREEFYRYQGDGEFEYESIQVTIPIIHNEDMQTFARCGTSTWSPSWSIEEYHLGSDKITFEFDIKGYQFDYKQNPQQINSILEQKKRQITDWIGWINGDIAKENTNLRRDLTNFINQRKTKLEQDKKFITDFNSQSTTPIKMSDDPAAKKIILNTTPLVKKVAPKPSAPPEYVLDQQMVLDIIAFVNNQGQQFEKTPKDFMDFDEMKLRNVLLVNLNSIFRGKATGETFSNKGKTDIYLNIDQGNILVFECKIWAGQALYQATIDQLIGYLTWRNNFGVMITFAKKKNFVKILEDAPTNITSHPTYVNGFKKISETHFVSHNHLSQDESKKVELHHLFYNLYSE